MNSPSELPNATTSQQNNKMTFWIVLLPLIVYTLVEEFYGLYWGLICGIVIGVLELIFEKWQYKKISSATWLVNIMVIGLGFLSLYENDGVWFKLQPAFAEGLMVILLWGSILLKKPFLVELSKKQNMNLPPFMDAFLSGITFRLGVFFLIHTALATWAAIKWTTAQWAILKGIGFTLSFIFYLFIELFVFLKKQKKRP